jgi:hypothetical protein
MFNIHFYFFKVKKVLIRLLLNREILKFFYALFVLPRSLQPLLLCKCSCSAACDTTSAAAAAASRLHPPPAG